MKRIVTILCAICFSATAAAQDADVGDVAVALVDDLVQIDTGFSGARLTLFGAVIGVDDPENAVDIISVIRGPETDFEIRLLEKKNLIWAPGDAHLVENAPGLYITAATRPINDVTPLPDQAAFQLGPGYLNIHATRAKESGADPAHDRLFEKAFLTEIEDSGLYQDQVGGFVFRKNTLFALHVNLPANTPVGDYQVSVFLYRDGVLLGQDSAALIVNKVGIERRIYDLAQERPVTYGLLCVCLSLFAGWVAAFAFRK